MCCNFLIFIFLIADVKRAKMNYTSASLGSKSMKIGVKKKEVFPQPIQYNSSDMLDIKFKLKNVCTCRDRSCFLEAFGSENCGDSVILQCREQLALLKDEQLETKTYDMKF